MKLFCSIFAVLIMNVSHAEDQYARDSKGIKTLAQSIQMLAQADVGCEKNDDCAAVAIGSRACGGPQSYVVTSALNPNYAEVVYLANISKAKEAAFNVEYNVFSICSIEFMPSVQCVQAVCQKVENEVSELSAEQ